MKKVIENKLKKINQIKAVITVPSSFTLEQRNATLSAAQEAGFQVLELLEESTAIALYHFSRNDMLELNSYFLVYDMGASDFKIGIFKSTANNFVRVGSASDTGVSGKDFDFIIFDYISNYLKREYNFDVKPHRNVIRKLLVESESVKINLSFLKQTTITLHNKIPRQDVNNFKITRGLFEMLAHNLMKKSVNIVEQCLNNHNISKKAIKQVILCGGSSRIPKIQNLLQRFFEDIINYNRDYVFEDTIFAKGAALFARVVSLR